MGGGGEKSESYMFTVELQWKHIMFSPLFHSVQNLPSFIPSGWLHMGGYLQVWAPTTSW